MVRSLAVVLVLVGGVVVLSVADQPGSLVREIDYAGAVAQARGQTPYDVLAPRPLPAGWRATSARVRPEGDATTWHLGLVTRSGDYAAVEQTDGARAGFVDRFLDGARPAGTIEIAGVSWRRLQGGEPEPRGLVRTVDGVTTVLAGSAGWGDLERLASALAP